MCTTKELFSENASSEMENVVAFVTELLMLMQFSLLRSHITLL